MFFFKILENLTNKLNFKLFTQVALYEIITTNNQEYFYKIKSKSIDFVITDEKCKIKLCIELDDPTHNRLDRIKRDVFFLIIMKVKKDKYQLKH